MYANLKNNVGGWGIPGWNTECEERLELYYKCMKQPH